MNFEDVLLGIAIGDAFGAGLEFQDRDWIKANVDFSKFINARHLINTFDVDTNIFTKNYNEWDYTDDTEMTIGVINALLSKEQFSEELLLKHWTIEYNKGIKEKGYGRNGHGSMRWVFNGEKSIEEVRVFQRDRKYPGNAPPMRAVPLGFLLSDDIDKYAIINADATHPHPKTRAASIIVARATEYLLVKYENSNKIISYCLKHIQGIDKETADLLTLVNQLPTPSELKEQHYEVLCGKQPITKPRFLPGIKGLPSDAMLTGACVLYVLKHSTSAFDGLKNAIKIGGDVDSIASICTGILAGRYGIDSLPNFMVKNVEAKEKLRQLASTFQDLILSH
ncbi:MAG: ADP-ribosylglycohydrolase [Thalassobius sp.]|nr:ADP-ribosylglycohydrolase [Thalassovita sp.]